MFIAVENKVGITDKASFSQSVLSFSMLVEAGCCGNKVHQKFGQKRNPRER